VNIPSNKVRGVQSTESDLRGAPQCEQPQDLVHQGAREGDDRLFAHAAMFRDAVSHLHSHMQRPPRATSSTAFLQQSQHVRCMVIADLITPPPGRDPAPLSVFKPTL
jgi:hypothetical protein